jgi:multidrug transporter EmrE-like cation transporter
MSTQLWEIGLIVIASLFNGAAPSFLKRGVDSIKKFSIKNFISSKDIYIGVILYGLSIVVSIPAFKGGEISVLYPIFSLIYIWACLFGVKLLGEKMNKLKWLGIGLIIVGSTIIGVTG